MSFNRLLLAAIPLWLSCWAVGDAMAQDNTGLRQSGIAVEATAADAVQAREVALAGGRRAALNRLAAAVGTTAPSLSDRQIDGMVASIQIEEERVTSTRYSGRITVVFNNQARNMLGGGVTGGSAGSGGGGGGYAAPGPMAGQPTSNYLEASTSFGSLAQWLDLRRRLLAAGPVASVNILAISTDGALLRLGLRAAPPDASTALADGGVLLTPPGTAGEPWRVGLGG
ncbi:MAG: hypothetical protein H7345_08620 [Rubritepida sp.]|nr:hypothetical protein [Rubritepida sp.]